MKVYNPDLGRQQPHNHLNYVPAATPMLLDATFTTKLEISGINGQTEGGTPPFQVSSFSTVLVE